MRGVLLAALLLTGFGFSVHAQRISRVNSGLDLGTGFAQNQWSPSILYYQALHPAHAPWVQLTGGARIWSYFGKETELLSASKNRGRDQMLLGRVSAMGASFMMGLNLRVANVVEIGGNADLLGFAFGKRRSALYQLARSETVEDTLALKLNGDEVDIAPANLNILPAFTQNSNGQAEVFVRIWFGPQIGIKGGYIWGQNTYRTDVRLNDLRRFSSRYSMPYVALCLPLYN